MHERIQHSKADVMKIDAERNVLLCTLFCNCSVHDCGLLYYINFMCQIPN